VVRKIVAMCLILLVGACLFICVSATKTRRDAKTILEVIRELSVSKSPNDTFDSFRWKYRGKLKDSNVCSMHFCTYEADISNKAIAKLHLLPYTEMKVWFVVSRGKLATTMVEYRVALEGANSPVVHVQQDLCTHGCGVRFDVNPHGTTKQSWNGLVEFNASAAQRERDAALAFNLDCFSRVRGCQDLTDLLPTVWQRAGSGQITSRLVGLSQRLEESHEFPTPDDF
jgi:hypothetical protein